MNPDQPGYKYARLEKEPTKQDVIDSLNKTKEEIKPAPLGESSEEQKDGFMIIDVFNDDGSHSHYALISTKTGEKLWSENPKECKAQGYPVSSPASEAPEEHTEILSAIDNLIAVLHGDGGHYREKHGRLKAIEDAHALLHKKWVVDEGERVQSEQNAMILDTLLDLNDQCYHYMKANPPDKTKMTYNSWESILEQLQYHKSEYGTGKAPEEQEELWKEVIDMFYYCNSNEQYLLAEANVKSKFSIHRKRD